MTRPGPSFDADYLLDDIAAAEPWHFWFRARRRLVLWALRFYFPSLRSVLDVGCGTGFVLDGLQRSSPDLALAGSDIRSMAGASLPIGGSLMVVAQRPVS